MKLFLNIFKNLDIVNIHTIICLCWIFSTTLGLYMDNYVLWTVI